MAYVRNPVVYVPDLTNGRPIVDGKVYLLTSGTIPPMHDSTIDPADLLTVTYINEARNAVEQPQPLYTSKGGCLYGNFPDAARQFMIAPQAYVFAAYSNIGQLQYSAETTAGDYVEIDELASTSSTILIGGTEAKEVGRRINYVNATDPTPNSSVIFGELGAPTATAPTRASWAYNGSPTTGVNGLFLPGNYIEPTVLGAAIIQGRAGYYSYLTAESGVGCSTGGDNYIDQLAGMAFGYHIDLIKDSGSLGSHGAVFGGSWKRVRGDYSGSFAGTQHVVSGQNAVAIGGNNIRIGSEVDALLSRRSSTVGGQLNQVDGINSFIYSSEQSAMNGDYGGILGGLTHANAAAQSVIIGGNTNEHTSAAIRSVTLAGQRNKTTAFMAITHGSDALNDVDYSHTQANGKFANQGDCQVHYVVGRRAGSAGSTTVDITSQGGGGAPYLYTPRAGSILKFDFNVVCARTDVVGQTASFKVVGSITNIGGTLTIKSQTTTVDHRDDAAYNCVLALAGGSTAVVLRGTVPSTSHVTRWTASGTITLAQL